MLYSKTQAAGLWKLGDFSLVCARGPRGKDKYVEDPSQLGTDGYRAPEVINRSCFGYEVDIWAMGCTLYQLMCSRPLFADNFDVANYAQTYRYDSETPDVLSLTVRYLTLAIPWKVRGDIKLYLNQIFAISPEDRPTATQLGEVFEKMVKNRVPSQRGLNASTQ